MSQAGSPDERVQIEKLSILIPVYNEIRTLGVLLDRVLAADLPCDREIIVVDDGSTDGSREMLDDYAGRHDCIRVFLHERNQGKGGAIRTAIEQITGDWAIIQDADLEYDPSEYRKLLLPAQLGKADAVFGSRFAMGDYRRAMYFWHTFANKGVTLLANLFSGLNLTDVETCYKLIRSDILRNFNLHSNSFDIEPELTVKLARWGARIYEVPISYSGRTYAEGKKIHAKDAFYALAALVRYRFFDPNYCKHEGFLILQAIERSDRFNRWLFGQFKDYLGDEVLEAGCGIGNLTKYVLDKKRLVCVDLDDFYVQRLRESFGSLANLEVCKADLSTPEDLVRAMDDRPLDSVFCINVLEHIEDHVRVLENFRAILKEGGRVVVLVPHSPELYTGVDKTLGHLRRYTPELLTETLNEAGFNVVKCWGFNRVGGLGWRVSGKILKKDTLTTGQMRIFEWLMPLVRLTEKIPFHRHNSLIIVGEKESS